MAQLLDKIPGNCGLEVTDSLGCLVSSSQGIMKCNNNFYHRRFKGAKVCVIHFGWIGGFEEWRSEGVRERGGTVGI